MKRLRTNLTYANVVATLALFLVIAGGSAFAASQLAKNSVGSKQIKKNAVTAAKIKNGAITPAKLSDSSRSELAGPQGAQGPQGPKGEQGTPGPFPATLPAGKTVVGTFDMEDVAAAANGLATSEISYVFSAPGQIVRYVKASTSDPDCTGSAATPTAPAGFTCIYELSANNASGSRGINTSFSAGVNLYVFSAAGGQFSVWGTWAATGK